MVQQEHHGKCKDTQHDHDDGGDQFRAQVGALATYWLATMMFYVVPQIALSLALSLACMCE
jgi:hypothetical protein